VAKANGLTMNTSKNRSAELLGLSQDLCLNLLLRLQLYRPFGFILMFHNRKLFRSFLKNREVESCTIDHLHFYICFCHKNIVLLYIVCYTAQYISNRSTAVLKDKCSLYFYDQYKHVLAKVRHSYLSDMTGIYLCMTYCGPETRGVAAAVRTDYHDSHTHISHTSRLSNISYNLHVQK
jgi:hypothetical protein